MNYNNTHFYIHGGEIGFLGFVLSFVVNQWFFDDDSKISEVTVEMMRNHLKWAFLSQFGWISRGGLFRGVGYKKWQSNRKIDPDRSFKKLRQNPKVRRKVMSCWKRSDQLWFLKFMRQKKSWQNSLAISEPDPRKSHHRESTCYFNLKFKKCHPSFFC